MDAYRKYSRGERLKALPKPLLDAATDAAKRERGQRLDFATAARAELLDPAVIRVQNTTADALDRGNVLELGASLFPANANLSEYLRRVVYTGQAPAGDGRRVAVLIEPIPAGGIGRAVILGSVPALVNLTTAGDPFCYPAAGVTGHLVTSAGGPGRAEGAPLIAIDEASGYQVADDTGTLSLDGDGNPVPATTGLMWCRVFLGGGAQAAVIKIQTGTPEADGTYDARIETASGHALADGNAVWALELGGGGSVSGGDRYVACLLDGYNGRALYAFRTAAAGCSGFDGTLTFVTGVVCNSDGTISLDTTALTFNCGELQP